jgi:hypothetical protein
MTQPLPDQTTRILRAIAPHLTLAFTPPIDSRLDGLQRQLLNALSNACKKRGGALYGSLSEIQGACCMTFLASDLDKLYEVGLINVLKDQTEWIFVQMENAR